MAGQGARKVGADGRNEPDSLPAGATVSAVEPDSGERSDRSITARAIALGIPLCAVNAYWVTLVEVRWYTLDGTSLPLFITPIFFLFVLVLLNRLVAHWRPHAALRQGELLVVYIGLALSCVFAGHDMLQNLFGAMGHAYQ